MIKAIFLVIHFLLVYSVMLFNPAYGATETGVQFVDTVELKEGTTLVLNGTGIRRKWFVKVYVAGLYLPQASRNTNEVLSMTGPKRIRMHFLYRKVSRKKLLATLDKGFNANHTQVQIEALSDKIALLKSLFKTVRKGDEVILDYTPVTGTQVFFNEELQGTIAGFEFHQAILRVWLGDQPADKKLKQGLLGIDD